MQITDFRTKVRSAKRDIHLPDQLGLARAIWSGDFVTKVNGSDPDGVAHRIRFEAQARDPGGKWIPWEMPGSEFSHNRFVLLEQSRYPAFIATQDALDAQRTEFETAVGAIFSDASRSSR